MEIKSLIAYIMQANGILGIIDNHKDDNISLKDIQNKWTEKYKIKASNHIFLNQYQFLVSLLAFIVLPKEELYEKIPRIEINQLPNNWGITSKGNYKLNYFIRRLRNCIVHNGIDVSNSLIFTFKDVNPKDKTDIFEVTFDEKELRDFVHSFAYWVMTEKV